MLFLMGYSIILRIKATFDAFLSEIAKKNDCFVSIVLKPILRLYFNVKK